MAIETFSDGVKFAVVTAQNGYCAAPGCLNKIHSLHHKLHNTKSNRRRYPLFIHSPFNAIGLCHNDHQNKQHLWRITEREARVYEDHLEKIAGVTQEAV